MYGTRPPKITAIDKPRETTSTILFTSGSWYQGGSVAVKDNKSGAASVRAASIESIEAAIFDSP